MPAPAELDNMVKVIHDLAYSSAHFRHWKQPLEDGAEGWYPQGILNYGTIGVFENFLQ